MIAAKPPRLDAMQEQLDLHEAAIERICIQALTWDHFDDLTKRLDFLEEQLRHVSEKTGCPW